MRLKRLGVSIAFGSLHQQPAAHQRAIAPLRRASSRAAGLEDSVASEVPHGRTPGTGPAASTSRVRDTAWVRHAAHPAGGAEEAPGRHGTAWQGGQEAAEEDSEEDTGAISADTLPEVREERRREWEAEMRRRQAEVEEERRRAGLGGVPKEDGGGGGRGGAEEVRAVEGG